MNSVLGRIAVAVGRISRGKPPVGAVAGSRMAPAVRTFSMDGGESSPVAAEKDVKGPRVASHARPADPVRNPYSAQFKLRDGSTTVRVEALNLRDARNRGALRDFYASLDSMSGLKGGACHDRHHDHAEHLEGLNQRAAKCDERGGRVVVARRDGDGAIIGACLMDYDRDRGEAWPNRMVTAASERCKGVGTAMKTAQLEIARMDGFRRVVPPNMSTDIQGIYDRAVGNVAGAKARSWPIMMGDQQYGDNFQVNLGPDDSA